MMNGWGSFSTVRPTPLTQPTARPISGPIRRTRGQGTSAFEAIASATMASAMIDPTERSMPAVTMTTYMPSASRAREAFCFRMLVRFCADRKTSGLMAASASIMTMTTRTMP